MSEIISDAYVVPKSARQDGKYAGESNSSMSLTDTNNRSIFCVFFLCLYCDWAETNNSYECEESDGKGR